MHDSPAFTVDQILLSDFVSSDPEGKPTLVGIHLPPINYAELPETFPSLFLTIFAQPVSQQFKMGIFLDSPDKRSILRVNVDYSAEEVPDSTHRLVLNFQLPPVPFPGPGEYRIRIKDEHNSTVFQQPLLIRIAPQKRFEVKVNARVEVNTEFTGGNQIAVSKAP